jgi:2-polyprenyl-3-methyl-5-hydroxy-6-metoxy-1,4-benzoquinol methylase
MLRKLLATKGIHYFVTRFGSPQLKSAAFDEKYRRGDWHNQGDESGELAQVAYRYLCNGDLLIMGCGGASVLKGLVVSGFESALGVDISAEAIRLARSYASDNVSFRQADMIDFEPHRSYNVILFSESIYYVPTSRQETLLRRLSLSLKPNGVFIVTFAQANRYQDTIVSIRENFSVIEDRPFAGSTRHLLIFRPSSR